MLDGEYKIIEKENEDKSKLIIDTNILIYSKDVQPSSPAALAGLRSNSDYIIGSDSLLTEVINDYFFEIIFVVNSRVLSAGRTNVDVQ